jgi:uncharacterized membrane protein
MLQVDDHFEVAAARDEVWRAWTDFERFPSFMTGVDSVYAETSERLRWRLSVAGVQPSLYAIVIERVEGRRIAWVSVDQSTMGWWIDLDDADGGGTRVTVRVIWSPRGDAPSKAGARELDELTIRCDLQRFRASLEGALQRAA